MPLTIALSVGVAVGRRVAVGLGVGVSVGGESGSAVDVGFGIDMLVGADVGTIVGCAVGVGVAEAQPAEISAMNMTNSKKNLGNRRLMIFVLDWKWVSRG